MKLRNLILAAGVVGLLTPATLFAADSAETAAPAAATTDTASTATAAEKTAKPVEATAAPKDKPKSNVYCGHATGSIIRPSPKNGCKAAVQPNRSYSQEDLERTGEIDLNQALRKVDVIFH